MIALSEVELQILKLANLELIRGSRRDGDASPWGTSETLGARLCGGVWYVYMPHPFP